jgi:hypothetical protein
VADEHWRVVEAQRLTRTQFERWFLNREVSLVIMEACGSAPQWARWLNGLGIEVRLPRLLVHERDCRIRFFVAKSSSGANQGPNGSSEQDAAQSLICPSDG